MAIIEQTPAQLAAAGVNVGAQGDWHFVCDEPSCGFTSFGWPTQAIAEDRAAQHAAEHATGTPMQELRSFERRHDTELRAHGILRDSDAGYIDRLRHAGALE